MNNKTSINKANSDKNLVGIGLMIGFCFIAPVLDVFAKLAADEIPIAQITAVRFIGQALIMFLLIIILKRPVTVSIKLLLPLFYRALCLITATYCFFFAIRTMPIADAVAIVFIEPFILLLIGRFFLKEVVGIRRLSACATGFIGVMMVIKPSFMNFGIIALYPLGTAVSFALYMISTRRLSKHLDPIRIQSHTALCGTILCTPILFFGNLVDINFLELVMPRDIFWVWLLGVAVFGTISHLFISYALKFASSTILAPLHYLEIISAVFFGFLIFGDIPNITTIFGMFLIILSGVYIFFREQKLQLQADSS
mgnify:CR=1 FL=1